MAKRIFALVEHIALLASQQGGYVARQDIATHLGMASKQAFNALIPAKGPRSGPGLNRAVDSRLRYFLRRQQYRTQPTNSPRLPIVDGQFTLPADCAYVDYYDMPGARTVQEVMGSALRYRRDDPIAGPTIKSPIVGEVENGDKQVYPASIDSVDVIYYCYPTVPVYAEIDATEDAPAKYDDTASVDAGWGPEMDPELTVRTLRLMGLEIRDPQLQGVAAQLTAESL